MNKKKKLLVVITALSIGVSLSACGNGSIANTETVVQMENSVIPDTETFVLVSVGRIQGAGNIMQYIVYDPATFVMYSQTVMVVDGYHAIGATGGMTMLYNADGTPRLYESKTETE